MDTARETLEEIEFAAGSAYVMECRSVVLLRALHLDAGRHEDGTLTA
jgi:hypothetical protein